MGSRPDRGEAGIEKEIGDCLLFAPSTLHNISYAT